MQQFLKSTRYDNKECTFGGFNIDYKELQLLLRVLIYKWKYHVDSDIYITSNHFKDSPVNHTSFKN